jgi:hypothetical protein
MNVAFVVVEPTLHPFIVTAVNQLKSNQKEKLNVSPVHYNCDG